MTTIVLVDDHQVVRQGLRALLDAQEGFSVIGEAGDGLEATQLVEELQPDILLVDLMMPGLNGLEVARQLNEKNVETRVIVLSMHANEAYVLEALRCGASGYVLKDASAAELVRAVRRVAAGNRHLSPPLSERAIEFYLQKAKASAVDGYEALTNREREVLHLSAKGYTNAEIAAQLSISPRTAETHRSNMMRKLDLRTRTDLIRYALQRGILPLDIHKEL